MVGLISIVILIPLAGAIALYIGQPKNARTVALIFNALSAFYAVMLWQKFDVTASGLQLVERHVWIPSIGAEYLVGVDGLSLLRSCFRSPFPRNASNAAPARSCS